MACTVYPDADHHKLRYRLLVSSSETCGEASDVQCGWRGKLLTCLVSNRVSIYEFSKHTTALSSPKKKKLTLSQKDFCREMAEHHLRALRIRHAMPRKFATPPPPLPPPPRQLATFERRREQLFSYPSRQPRPSRRPKGLDTSEKFDWS
ncbi:hypothetical protein GQ600_1935 [Phytophthora cactorum]|nr:hypothetical protein GQ600_1935 [Phytophthora cactorum]